MNNYRVASFVISTALLVAPSFAFASFDVDLEYGDQGSEVVKVQQFLAAQGHFTAKATGGFFDLTRKAVKAFQSAQGIQPVSGFWGPITRARANAMASQNSNTNTTTNVNTTDTSSTAGDDEIQQLLKKVQELTAKLAALKNGSTNTETTANTVTTSANTATGSCTFNNEKVAHGASVTAYQASSVAAGLQCMSQTRTCNNGTLSGTYTYSTCSIATAAQNTNSTDLPPIPPYHCQESTDVCMDSITQPLQVGHDVLNNFYPLRGKAPFTFTLESGTIPPGITAKATPDGNMLRIEGNNKTVLTGEMLTGGGRAFMIVKDATGKSSHFTIDWDIRRPNTGDPGYVNFTVNDGTKTYKAGFNYGDGSMTTQIGKSLTFAWNVSGASACTLNWAGPYRNGATAQTYSKAYGTSGSFSSAFTAGSEGGWTYTMDCPLSSGGSAPTMMSIGVDPASVTSAPNDTNTSAAPSCSISYSPSTLSNGSNYTTTWTSSNAVSRTYVISGAGNYGPYSIAVSGSTQTNNASGLPVGTFTRTDTVTNSTGVTATCSTSYTVTN